jgi:hypothetical protein
MNDRNEEVSGKNERASHLKIKPAIRRDNLFKYKNEDYFEVPFVKKVKGSGVYG